MVDMRSQKRPTHQLTTAMIGGGEKSESYPPVSHALTVGMIGDGFVEDETRRQPPSHQLTIGHFGTTKSMLHAVDDLFHDTTDHNDNDDEEHGLDDLFDDDDDENSSPFHDNENDFEDFEDVAIPSAKRDGEIEEAMGRVDVPMFTDTSELADDAADTADFMVPSISPPAPPEDAKQESNAESTIALEVKTSERHIL